MPRLPPELEREIFELAFRSHRDAALWRTLCLVARRVQCWIDLIHYEMVTINDDLHADTFLALIEANTKPLHLFDAVKTLCLPYTVKETSACGILAVCTRVERLACWLNFKDSPELPVLLSRLPLRQLSLEIIHFCQIPLAPSTWLSDLTHLELVAWKNYDAAALYKLSHLPQLTHVALNFDRDGMGVEHIVAVLSSCPHLQIFVAIVQSDELYLDFELDDYRIVVQATADDVIKDWEASYLGLADMWSVAEATVEEQRQEAFDAIFPSSQ
ncbi:hypothetical protein B0H16DRAFT_1497330 [Mycena metata]|uniref:Uncharacterized protein n=1 Tax=Mycena metata TaxID=1033252 RepID=A0AAD7KE06_9AGAR|nr:hypothetical protein B0H16DRAFT_1497330 [Mycena metata]